jgi:hypothetical protein
MSTSLSARTTASSPGQADSTFARSGIDVPVLGDYLVYKDRTRIRK